MKTTSEHKGGTTMNKTLLVSVSRRVKQRLSGRVLLVLLLAMVLLPSGRVSADLLHNSVDTGSGTSKWPTGWGIAGGKYGQFVCATCHEPDADNMKNIRRTINTMDGSNWPNGSTLSTVYFLNQTSMGNDRQKHNKSNRICEVCHSRNDFHNYSSGSNIAMGHPLNVPPPIVCVSCHKHNTGFKAACGNCHGNPPVTAVLGTFSSMVSVPRPSNALTPGRAGAHRTHVYTRNMVCETCHYISNGGIAMPNQSATIQIGFFGFGGKVTDGTYTPYTSATRGYRFASGTANTTVAPASTSYATANQCANVYCHGGGSTSNGKPPLTGGADPIPNWDGVNQNSCGSCHGATAASPPTMGSHAKHAAATAGYKYVCDTCHPSIDISHVQGSVRWEMNTTDPKVGAGATYRSLATGFTNDLAPSATYGQCSNINCHSNGKGGAANISSPTWGQTFPAGCSGCHGGDATSATPIATGKHTAHVNNAAALGTNYYCADCHSRTSKFNAISSPSRHVNLFVEYSGSRAGKSSTYVSATGICSATYCHTDGKGTAKSMTTDNWNAATTLDCKGCHGLDAAPAFASTAGEPNYANQGAGLTKANSHDRHMGGIGANTCVYCHGTTMTSAGAIITASTTHTNRSIDIAAGAGKTFTYVAGTKTCSTISCHGTGAAPAQWGQAMPIDCTGCHGNNSTSATPQTSGKHTAHMNNAAVIGTNIGCGSCHALTVSADRTIADLAFHGNGFKNITGANMGGRAAYNTTTGVCSASYCHTDGKGTAKSMVTDNWKGATTMGCAGCHGTDAAPAFTSVAGEPNYVNAGGAVLRSNSHQSHTTRLALTGAASCDYCHTNTVTTAGTAIKPVVTTHLDRVLNVDFNTTKATATWNSVTKTCSNISCHSGATSIWGDPSSAGCAICHGALSAKHGVHIGDLLTSGAASFYNFTANRSVGTAYRIGCANCHPTDLAKHRNGTVDLSINKNKVGGSFLNTLNSLATADGINVANSGITGTTGTNVVCSASYCHSNGRIAPLVAGDFKASPSWYAAPVTTNRCGLCHDNPPQYAGQSHYNPASNLGNNGTPPYRETGHMINIHATNTYVGNKQNGFLGFSSSSNKAHGNPALSTTIGCYICHSGIVSSAQIDTYAMNGTSSSFRCGSCHTAGSRTPLQAGQIVNAGLHVNGTKDVAFAPITFKTKAQLSYVANALGWTRNGAYKAAGSYDSFDLSVATWNQATKTCLTACHVNQPNITWGAQLQCVSCHANQ